MVAFLQAGVEGKGQNWRGNWRGRERKMEGGRKKTGRIGQEKRWRGREKGSKER